MNDLVRLAGLPAPDDGFLAAKLQQVLAQAVVAWDGTRRSVTRADPVSIVAWLTATQTLDHLLGGLKPALRRRATRPVRLALRPLRKTLLQAARAQASLLGWHTLSEQDPAAFAPHLSRLLESARLAVQATTRAAAQAARSAEAREASALLATFVVDLPVRRKQVDQPVAAAAPRILDLAAAHLAHRQTAFLAAEPATWRGAASAFGRLRAVVTALGPTPPAAEVTQLLQDLDLASHTLEDLARLGDMERLAAAHLDAWALRQGRQRAPQLHGAEGLLELLRVLRAGRTHQSRALLSAWRPVRGRALHRRVRSLWRPAPGGTASGG